MMTTDGHKTTTTRGAIRATSRALGEAAITGNIGDAVGAATAMLRDLDEAVARDLAAITDDDGDLLCQVHQAGQAHPEAPEWHVVNAQLAGLASRGLLVDTLGNGFLKLHPIAATWASQRLGYAYGQTTAEYREAIALNADRWVPANGGHETPIRHANGRTLLWCYNPAQERHAYIDKGTDLETEI